MRQQLSIRNSLVPFETAAFRAPTRDQPGLGIAWPILPALRRTRPPRRQIAFSTQFLLNFNAPILSPLLLDVERVLIRLARAAQPMLTNPILAERSGTPFRQSAARALNQLEQAKRITIERQRGRRRVFVVALGLWTAWGESRPGHAPFTARAKGEPPIVKPRSENSSPLAAQIPQALPKDYRPVVVGPAKTCQFPLWEDGQRPDGRFCCTPSVAGKSWCAAHVRVVYGNPE